MATGDIKNNIRKLLALLRKMKYPEELDIEKLAAGGPEALQEIYHYAFVNFSPSISEEIQEKLGLELGARTDMRFTNGLYRILRDIYNYKPSITKEQFTSFGFAERKIIMATDVLEMVRSHHATLTSKQSKSSIGSDSQSRPINKVSKVPRITLETDKLERQYNCPTNVLKSKIPKLNAVNATYPSSPTCQKVIQGQPQISPYITDANNNESQEEKAELIGPQKSSDSCNSTVLNFEVKDSLKGSEPENLLYSGKENLANSLSSPTVKTSLSCGSEMNEKFQSETMQINPINDSGSSSACCLSPEITTYISGPRTSSPATKSKSSLTPKIDAKEFHLTFWEFQRKAEKNFELILIKLTEMDARLTAVEDYIQKNAIR